MNIQISPVIDTDVDAIAALAKVVWQDTYPQIISQAQIDFMLAQRYNAPRLLEELGVPGVCWEKAIVDGQLAAFASTLQGAKPGEMKLDKLYVDPDRQRLGIGGRLIDHVVKRARSQGCHALTLAVNKRNVRAIAAYKTRGFVVREAVRLDIGNDFVMDDFIMVRSLL